MTYCRDEHGNSLIGTQLFYEGKNFDSIDELLEFLENDPGIEILGFSRRLYHNDQTVKLFNPSETLQQKLSKTTLVDVARNDGDGDGLCLENSLYLKPLLKPLMEYLMKRIVVHLTISWHRSALKLDSSDLLFIRECYSPAQLLVPDQCFALLPDTIYESDCEPIFEGKVDKQNTLSHEPRLLRSIVLILRPTIFNKESCHLEDE